MRRMAIMEDGLPGITRASLSRTSEEVVVRNRTRALGIVLMVGITAIALCIGGVIAVAKGHSNGAAIAVPIANAIVFYVGWLVAFRTTVRLRRESMVIENAVLRYSIPWRQGRQFYVHNGLRLRLLDGRTYGVWAFQGSLGAALNHYAAFKPIIEQLDAESDRIVGEHLPEYPPPPTSWSFQLPDWWVPLAVAAVSEAIVLIAYASAG
jgi:hypothetical protein